MSTRARILESDHITIQAVVYGPSEGSLDAIAKVLPEPKIGTRHEWASRFYDTGVVSGKGVIWAWFA